MHPTLPLLQDIKFPPIQRTRLDTLQVNLGYRCNQQCIHCHVNAAPNRREMMDTDTASLVISYIKTSTLKVLDLTGGAPELNPHFRELVLAARQQGLRVIDRCNLTILEEPGQEDLAQFLAQNQVEVIASLPCYLEDNVDQQRGKGVYQSSIRGLKQLNQLGYGKAGSSLQLNLVYNPQGAVLPPAQEALEADYKQHLWESDEIVFNHLFTLTNMPINRFGSMLISKGEFYPYLKLLQDSQQQGNLASVMCRSLISVDWQGYLYDCDFNQMLDLPMTAINSRRPHMRDLIGWNTEGLPIVTAGHCYGCTAGQGSSCGGALG